MKNINPTGTKSWKLLEQHFCKMSDINLIDLFNQDKDRFSRFSKIFNNEILVDYSKNLVTLETMDLLISLAEECDLTSSIVSMFNGDKINCNEDRSVLHIALRNRSNIPIIVDGCNIMSEINSVLTKMKKFSTDVIVGNWRGYTNKVITDIVNIGIGGSCLGPYMVTEALKPYKNHLNLHFVSNIDGSHITEVLKNLNLETTLFLISSKTFTTQETITNAYTALDWFFRIASVSFKSDIISKHFVALSANVEEVEKFGINPLTNMFQLWDWVGGRYSLWSSIGLPVMLSLGPDNFELLLEGAYAMDLHFKNAAFNKNLPVILALIGIWYNNFFQSETEVILPYDQHMYLFSSYLQQVNMESNGKNVDRNGFSVNYQTGPIVWGDIGTNGQHSFFQLIHQGTKMIPCDFIAPVISHHFIFDHHEKLLSNFFAQTKALAFGKSINEVIKEYKRFGKYYGLNQKIVPFKVFKGNIPSNSILVRKITPYSLGSLIALYEHKIFTQGVILNIYSFDQWGVELGKQLSENIRLKLTQRDVVTSCYDSSTNGLVNCYKSWLN